MIGNAMGASSNIKPSSPSNNSAVGTPFSPVTVSWTVLALVWVTLTLVIPAAGFFWLKLFCLPSDRNVLGISTIKSLH
jgi:hypothetical protein